MQMQEKPRRSRGLIGRQQEDAPPTFNPPRFYQQFHSLTVKDSNEVMFSQNDLPVFQVCWISVTSLYSPSSTKPSLQTKNHFNHLLFSDNHNYLFLFKCTSVYFSGFRRVFFKVTPRLHNSKNRTKKILVWRINVLFLKVI